MEFANFGKNDPGKSNDPFYEGGRLKTRKKVRRTSSRADASKNFNLSLAKFSGRDFSKVLNFIKHRLILQKYVTIKTLLLTTTN